jgi:hypothetical protein
LDAEASAHQKARADAWERGADQWLPARSVIASKAKQSRLGLRILRLSLDCFAVARNDDHPRFLYPSGGYYNSYAKRIFPFSARDEVKISLAKRIISLAN